MIGHVLARRRPGTRAARALATATLLLLAGCSAGPPEAPEDPLAGAWVGTHSTEGDVTTVISESGSVWGGEARLVEEASIGVESGDKPYLLGSVIGVGVAGERIYVLDGQVHRVRVYDLEGRHVMDLGGEGDGPGELRRPTSLAVAEERIYVRDPQTGRITVFSVDGELIDTWPTEPYFTPTPIVATLGGELLVPYRGGMYPWGPDGETGDPVPYPEVERPAMMSVRVTEAIEGYSPGAMLARPVPFVPLPVFAMAPTGAMIHGPGSPYRFRIEQPGGAATVVERAVDPVAVSAAEAAWRRERVTAFLRQAEAGWQWDGPEMPDTKPAYDGFVPVVSGEVWVLRPGPGYESNDCPADIPTQEPPASCWRDTRIVDAFGPEGRFLGTVRVPDNVRLEPRPFIRGSTVVALAQDEAGTLMVKRYRLVPPDGQR